MNLTHSNGRPLRKALARAAEAEWSKNIKDFDPGQEATPAEIQKYFDQNGWHWFLENHSDGTYTERWRNEPWQSFCGLFIAYCGAIMGNHFPGFCADVQMRFDIRNKVMPSTLRLHDSARWRKAGGPQPDRPGIVGLGPGDVITVGDWKSGAGSHIALVVRRGDGGVHTIEGNATGELADGTTGEGVVKKFRRFDEIHQTIRLITEHFDGEALT